MKQRYVLVDLFSGGGGYARGFDTSNRYKHVMGIDNYPPASKTYALNFPTVYFIADDIKHITIKIIEEYTGYGSGDIDVVIASPPCEPFTGANPKRKKDPLDRLYTDPAGQLFLHAIRLIGEIQPKAFVIENVPGIMERPIQRAIRRELARAGYDRIFFNVLKAEDHGTPSHRVRVFVSNYQLRPPHKKPPTVWEVLRDLPPPGAPYPPNHEANPIPSRHKRRVSRLGWGEALIYYQGARRRLPNYIRLHPYRIAPTVMGTSRFIHPFEDRLLTVREQARLMGFPDFHVFHGSRDAQYDMVGEAVPPPLAESIAFDLARQLDNKGE